MPWSMTMAMPMAMGMACESLNDWNSRIFNVYSYQSAALHHLFFQFSVESPRHIYVIHFVVDKRAIRGLGDFDSVLTWKIDLYKKSTCLLSNQLHFHLRMTCHMRDKVYSKVLHKILIVYFLISMHLHTYSVSQNNALKVHPKLNPGDQLCLRYFHFSWRCFGGKYENNGNANASAHKAIISLCFVN